MGGGFDGGRSRPFPFGAPISPAHTFNSFFFFGYRQVDLIWSEHEKRRSYIITRRKLCHIRTMYDTEREATGLF